MNTRLSPLEKDRRQISFALFWTLLVLVVGVAAFVRFYDLKSDPPILSSSSSQDLVTDGAYLTLHAKQAVLNEQWSLFGYQDWTPLKVSVVSGLSYLIFKLFGVSRSLANAVGALLSLGGIFLFLLALWDRRRRGFILLVAFFLCTNAMLAIYGRVPLAENGLFFLSGLTFLAYARWFHTIGGKIAVGLLVALCGLLGKSFGFLIGVGPLFYLLFAQKTNRVRNLLTMLLPALATFGIFWFLFYRDQGLTDFLWERGAGIHGFPHGFESLKGFIEALISYGRSGLHSDSVVPSLLCVFAILALLLSRKKSAPTDKTNLFMLGWIGSWILVLSPFNYLPLRYYLILIVPISVVAATFLDELEGTEIGLMDKLVWWRIGLVLITAWLFVYYLVYPFLAPDDLVEVYRAVWIAFPFALLATSILILIFFKRKFTLTGRAARTVLILVVVGTVTIEGYQYFRWFRGDSYLLEYASSDVNSLVGSDAVFAGSYGPALAYDTEIKSIALFETDDWSKVTGIMKSVPVTHLVLPELAWNDLVIAHPETQKARVITHIWMGEIAVVVARVTDVFGNPQAASYQLTDFEKLDLGIMYQQIDSTELYLKRFLTAHPDSRAGLVHLYYLSQGAQPLPTLKSCVETLVMHYPKDFAVCELAAIYYKALYESSHDPNDMTKSRGIPESFDPMLPSQWR